ncbi:hypothetical protein PGQ11_001244 [Apiospora arundinis]|uniref:Uncharacterized protein n=1 Tax=Apiospora arundinis TaxID=335852 RepID=A0ABR2JP80_9PEZI
MPHEGGRNSAGNMASKNPPVPNTTPYSLDQYLQSQPSTTAERQEAGLIGPLDQSGLKTALYIKKWESSWEQRKDNGKS